MRSLAQFSRHLETLLPRIGSTDFPELLIALFKDLVPVDDATIIFYPQTAMPEVDYFETDPEGRTNIELFARGAFLLDPYYQAAENKGMFGFFRLGELAPEAFTETEYYQTFYRLSDYEDECGYLVALGDAGFLNISLARSRQESPFDEGQLQVLEDIRPGIEELSRHHWGATEARGGTTDLRGQLNTALEAFGSSLLTERETQVINLVLHGHSTKSVADKLCISMETVKLHRKHAYAKLQISSQAELFYLFLESVMNAGDYTGGDTLESYLPARSD